MSKPKQHFVWGFGRLPSSPAVGADASSAVSTELAPKLIEAIESATALRTINAGTRHCSAVTHGGEVFVWGDTATLTGPQTRSPAAAAATATAGDTKSSAAGTVGAAKCQLFGRVSSLPESDSKVVTVASGGGTTGATAAAAAARTQLFAVTTSGVLYRWEVDSASAVAAAAAEDGTAKAGSAAPPTPVVAVPSVIESLRSVSVSRIACGSGGFVLALTLAGRLYSWGNDSHGRLGHGTNHNHSAAAAAASVSASASAAASTATSPHANANSVAAPRMIERLADKVVTAIACGWTHAAVVVEDGTVYSWGCGLNGRLGTGNAASAVLTANAATDSSSQTNAQLCSCLDQSTPTQVPGLGGVPIPSATPSLALGTTTSNLGQPIINISCGYHHTIALDVVGRLYCFGGGEYGQLGLGQLAVTTHAVAPPPSIDSQNAAASASANVSAPTPQPASDPFVRYRPTLITSASSSSSPRGAAVSAASSSFGDQHVVSVSCGSFHTCCVTALGEVWSWGWNSYGQLGHGDTHTRWRPTLVRALVGMDVSLVACGGSYTTAVTDQLLLVAEENYFSGHPHVVANAAAAAAASAAADASASYVPPTSATGTAAAAAAAAAAAKTGSAAAAAGVPPTSPVLFAESGSPALSGAAGGDVPILSIDQSDDHKPNKLKKHYNPASRPVLTAPPATAAAADDSKQKKSILQIIKDAFSPNAPAVPTATAAPATAPAAAGSTSTGPSVLDKLTGDDSRSEILSVGGANFRPGNLPPKSAADADKHKKEVARMSKLYREKLQREAEGKASKRREDVEKQRIDTAERQKKLKRDIEREKRLEEVSTLWLKTVLPAWESKKAMPSKARDLVWKAPGIPPRVRGQAWPLALGNALMITPELFTIFGTNAKKARDARLKEMAARRMREAAAAAAASGAAAPASSTTAAAATAAAMAAGLSGGGDSASGTVTSQSNKEDTFSYIDVDLTRTFPSLAFFQEECPMHEQLRGVLETYCFYRPDVGYVQGMSYLAGNFLLYMAPYAAFVCLSNMLNSPFFHVFLKLNPEKMNFRYKLFSQIFKDNLPDLFAHFQTESISPDLYFMEWCMTLFTKRLPLDVVGRVWDVVLLEGGEETVYRVAVAILKAVHPQLIDQPFEKAIKLLGTLPQQLNEESLFTALNKIKVSDAAKDMLKQLQEK